jgi:hypothetical protein
LCELKANKKEEFKVEIVYIVEVGFFNTSNSYLSLLADFFAFNFSFLILPDILSDNTPVPFL